jgi:ceramide glucosyltransferase
VILSLLLVALAAAGYQLLALAAAILHMRSQEPEAGELPPVSILKPVKGLDPHFYEAIHSYAAQNYPEFEILFGVADPSDPALPEIERLRAAFANRSIRIVYSASDAPNGKVATLIDLAAEARYPVLLVSDSDIRAPEGYLRRVTALLEDPGVGVVTCLYGGAADQWPGRFEAIGIASDFAPGVLVAPLVGVREFGLGSTLVFRRAQLDAIGGFRTLADYVADDYQLASRIHRLGFRIMLSKVVVQAYLSGRSWGEVWRHQLRWARTIRVSRGGVWGYLGMPVTQASLWALLLAIAGQWWPALTLLVLRLGAGLAVGVGVLGSRDVARYFWLMPFRDLWGFAVWVAGLFGDTVIWRGARLRLTPEGRIRSADPSRLARSPRSR